MKLITRDTDYGVRALRYIALKEHCIVSVKELVDELDMPRAFIRKILRILSSANILNSYKGRSGGFELAVSADEIFLIDLMKIFQGELRLNECVFKKKVCPDVKTCKLKKRIDKIQDYVIAELEDISLSSLIKGD